MVLFLNIWERQEENNAFKQRSLIAPTGFCVRSLELSSNEKLITYHSQ